jgi:spermidine synthase
MSEARAHTEPAFSDPTHTSVITPPRPRLDLFIASALVLYLELACIRWFPAHVVFLTFFTNTVLLASFLGMSVGCLAASQKTDLIKWSPRLLTLVMVLALATEAAADFFQRVLDVGNQASPQLVYFGTEYRLNDLSGFFIPVEALNALFFILVALSLTGPGQEMGRALNRVPNRIEAYSINILGSMGGIALFALCSTFELSPFWWFLLVALGLGYFIAFDRAAPRREIQWANLGLLSVMLLLASFPWRSTYQAGDWTFERFWSPYYRIDYVAPPLRDISVNMITHQRMVSRADDTSPSYAYALPYLLRHDAGDQPFQDVLIIGAGSGNDVSRALEWGAHRIDAVEIDPVILALGVSDHPDRPYQDPRVAAHLDDGRNFLHATSRRYDLVVYALVDSLVLHSGYSNLRLESYLFTEQAFRDVRRDLKPGGVFIIYNYFRQGWIVARLSEQLRETFGSEPLVLPFPYRQLIYPETSGGFTMIVAGDTEWLRRAFQAHPEYLQREGRAPGPLSPNGFAQHPPPDQAKDWERFGLAQVINREKLRLTTDDWPFLYLHGPRIPAHLMRGIVLMALLAVLLLLYPFLEKAREGGGRFSFDGRMFFLGAGFMLLETRAVVYMALLFGSTWMVNTVVFFAMLVMILLANLFVLKLQPQRLWPYYLGLLVSLVLNALISLDFFLGMNRVLQVGGSCSLVFAPILFAAVIFAVWFRQSREPNQDFGINVMGAMIGGLAEYTSMLWGFRYVVLVALAFYLLSWGFRRAIPFSFRGARRSRLAES